MNQEDEPNPLQDLINMMERDQKLKKDINSKINPLMDQVEKNVLMKLWSDVGNSQFDYFQNMHAIKQFVESLEGMRKVTSIPLDLGIIVQSALVECATWDLNAMKIIKEERDKLGIE